VSSVLGVGAGEASGTTLVERSVEACAMGEARTRAARAQRMRRSFMVCDCCGCAV
jgi:hypothetical protein